MSTTPIATVALSSVGQLSRDPNHTPMHPPPHNTPLHAAASPPTPKPQRTPPPNQPPLQIATIALTYAGQLIMCGLLRLKVSGGLRYGATRLVALIPALTVALVSTGSNKFDQLNQHLNIVQSLQLPFALLPVRTRGRCWGWLPSLLAGWGGSKVCECVLGVAAVSVGWWCAAALGGCRHCRLAGKGLLGEAAVTAVTAKRQGEGKRYWMLCSNALPAAALPAPTGHPHHLLLCGHEPHLPLHCSTMLSAPLPQPTHPLPGPPRPSSSPLHLSTPPSDPHLPTPSIPPQAIHITSSKAVMGPTFANSRPLIGFVSLVAVAVLAINGYFLVDVLQTQLPQVCGGRMAGWVSGWVGGPRCDGGHGPLPGGRRCSTCCRRGAFLGGVCGSRVGGMRGSVRVNLKVAILQEPATARAEWQSGCSPWQGGCSPGRSEWQRAGVVGAGASKRWRVCRHCWRGRQFGRARRR